MLKTLSQMFTITLFIAFDAYLEVLNLKFLIKGVGNK